MYYKADDMPAYNYFKIRKGGLHYAFKDEKKRKIPLKVIEMLNDLDFELNLIDTDAVYKLSRVAYFKGKYALTKDKKYRMRAKEIEKELQREAKPFDLDAFLYFIETALGNQKGSLDLRKLTVKRLFYLYKQAVKQARNGNN